MIVERLDPIVIQGLAHESIRVVGCRWLPKVVTTDPPRYVPHTEYSWTCDLVGEVPILGAQLFEEEDGLSWKRSSRDSGSVTLTIGLSFFPHDWNRSDEVQLVLSQGPSGWSGTQLTVRDASLKQDPRDFVGLDLADGKVFQTGALIRIGTVNSRRPLSAWLVAVAQADTESCRASRWRIRRRIPVDLPFALSFLKSGRRAGTFPYHRDARDE